MAVESPLVGILMGSKSDLPVMQAAADTLKSLSIPHEMLILSAHRTPDAVAEFAKGAEGRGMQVLIAAAGMAAHLAGVVSAYTILPVLGVPMESPALKGLDSLLAVSQMPGGVPVGTLAIGKAGAPLTPPCSPLPSWVSKTPPSGKNTAPTARTKPPKP